MGLLYEDLDVLNTEGKWFNFDTTIGDFKIQLRLLNPSERLIYKFKKEDYDNEKRYQEKYKKLLEKTVVGWEIEDANGNDIPYSLDKLKNPMFFGLLLDLKLTKPLIIERIKDEKTGEPIEFNVLPLVINMLVTDSELFINKDGETSFL